MNEQKPQLNRAERPAGGALTPAFRAEPNQKEERFPSFLLGLNHRLFVYYFCCPPNFFPSL